MFDMWLNITASAPGSSLVLLRYPPESERHLRATMRAKVGFESFLIHDCCICFDVFHAWACLNSLFLQGMRANQLRLLSKADLKVLCNALLELSQ
jgi:hypothetical protein